MKKLEDYLYGRVVPIIQNWDEKDIYAISFFVYANEEYEYHGSNNVSMFSIGYNTEKDCNYSSRYCEERWNFAFWRQDMTEIINPDDNGEGIKFLFSWYKENGIKNIGYEDSDNDYDENMCYIGKGPVGYYELLRAASNVARRLQMEGRIASQFGNIPIIVHELEYAWYIEEATKNANPNGEADDFLIAMREGFFE